MLEECEHQLQAQQQRCDAAKERLDWLVKTFSTVRAGVEHLAEKLQHVTLVRNALFYKGFHFLSLNKSIIVVLQCLLQSEDTVSEVHPDSDEFVVELMTQCELKLQLLNKQLEGKDLAALMKEMEEDEVRKSFKKYINTGVGSG